MQALDAIEVQWLMDTGAAVTRLFIEASEPVGDFHDPVAVGTSEIGQ
jgi:hypothetical protein